MQTLLSKSGVKILDNYYIVDWTIDDENQITKVVVESNLDRLELPCSLFVCLERKIVRRQTIQGICDDCVAFKFTPKDRFSMVFFLLVLNEARLVFDGRLVINAECQTNDPFIYAAGPMTKYKRILYAERYRHEHFSSTEVGEWLAKKIFEVINPLRQHGELIKNETICKTVHVFKDCKIETRPLLDGYFYVYIRPPGPLVPYNLMRIMDNYVCIS